MQWYQTQFVWGSHAPIKIEITLFSNPAHSLQCFVSACLYLKTYSFAPLINYVTAPLTQSLNACAHTHHAFSPPSVTRKHSGPKKPHKNFLELFQVWLIKCESHPSSVTFSVSRLFKDLCYCNISCCSNIPKTISTAVASAISLLSS